MNFIPSVKGTPLIRQFPSRLEAMRFSDEMRLWLYSNVGMGTNLQHRPDQFTIQGRWFESTTWLFDQLPEMIQVSSESYYRRMFLQWINPQYTDLWYCAQTDYEFSYASSASEVVVIVPDQILAVQLKLESFCT